MRCILILTSCLAVGCGASQAGPPDSKSPSEQPAPIALAQVTATLKANPAQADTGKADASKAAKVPDLRTRVTGSDWPIFLGPTQDSKSSETGITKPWPKDGPKIVWQRKLGIGYSMPSISRGRLIQFERFSDKAVCTCLKSETGELLWKFEYDTDYEDMYGYNNGPRCSPVIDDDRVYLYGPEGMLHCIRTVDGQEIWKYDTRTTFGVVQNFFGVGSTPIVEGDLLLVVVGGSPAPAPPQPTLDLKGNGTGIVAFDKLTGKVRYKITDELAAYAGPVTATIAGRRWCFVFARGGLVGFEPASGKVDFQFPWRAKILESVNASQPIVVGDQVLISETYGPGSALLKVKPGEYSVVWSDEERRRDKALQTHWNTPIHHNGYVYGSSGRHLQNAELRCIELATGKVMWSEPGLTRCSLMMVDGHFVCLSEIGKLLLLKVNPEKFDVVSQAWPRREGAQEIPGFGLPPLLKEPAWAAPILSHGLMYVRGDGVLVAMELIPKP